MGGSNMANFIILLSPFLFVGVVYGLAFIIKKGESTK